MARRSTKYDGVSVRHLKAREFAQIAGRAGRAGFDTAGGVVVQAPEHDIENAKQAREGRRRPEEAPAGTTRKKPPEGFVSWGEPTYDPAARSAEPEPLTSSLRPSPTRCCCNVAHRPGDFFAHMRHLLTRQRRATGATKRRAGAARRSRHFRSLLAGGVVERLPDAPDAEGRTVRVTVDLQPRLRAQPAARAVRAGRAGPARPGVADVRARRAVSVLESTLDGPPAGAQWRSATGPRGRRSPELKAEGVDYEERMDAASRTITYAEAAGGAAARPATTPTGAATRGCWTTRLSPKSVARDLSERAMTFVEYVVLLRPRPVGRGCCCATSPTPTGRCARRCRRRAAHRGGHRPHRVARRAGPPGRQLAARRVGGAGRTGDRSPALPSARGRAAVPRPVTGNARAFRVLVRNAVFRRVEAVRARPGRTCSPSWTRRSSGSAALAVVLRWSTTASGPGRTPAWPEPVYQSRRRGPGRWHGPPGAGRPGRRPRPGRLLAEVDLAASDAEGYAVVHVTGLSRQDGSWT